MQGVARRPINMASYSKFRGKAADAELLGNDATSRKEIGTKTTLRCMRSVFWRLAIFVLLLALDGSQGLVCAEPIYQGRPESYWVNLLSDNLERNAPDAAIIRSNAAFILSQHANADILLPIVKATSDSAVKRLILNGLVFNGTRNVTAEMVNALKDKDPKVRTTAITGLGLTAREKTDEELPALIKCLQDSDPEARSLASWVLCNYSYSNPQHPEQDQTNVCALAFVEIQKARNNPDSSISNAAAIAVEKYNRDLKKASSIPEPWRSSERIRAEEEVLVDYSRELAIQAAEIRGSKWTATLRVIDDAGIPVEGATVSVSYAIPPEPGEHSENTWKEIKGITDANGVFVASHSDSSGVLEIKVTKTNYYGSGGSYKFAYPGQFNTQRMASNRTPDITVSLKKIIHPVPMYVNRVDIAHREKPAIDKPIGFDLTIGDFVAPYGKGTNAQMYFTWHVDYDTNDLSATYGKMRSHGWDGRMTISFPNPGDGIEEFDLPGPFDNDFTLKNVGSELRSPQLAPASGYSAQLVKTNRWNFGELGSANNYDHLRKNYFLRVNTTLDDKGRVKTAQYGKIYGDFESAFTTYLNPEPNSLELEYDMTHNLGQGGRNFYITY